VPGNEHGDPGPPTKEALRNAIISNTFPPDDGAFPLRYFMQAFAFTWFFWGLGMLGERGVARVYHDRYFRRHQHVS
jgi:hypothetical protein